MDWTLLPAVCPVKTRSARDWHDSYGKGTKPSEAVFFDKVEKNKPHSWRIENIQTINGVLDNVVVFSRGSTAVNHASLKSLMAIE